MNLHLQPRTNLMPWHHCQSYVPSEPHGPAPSLTPQSYHGHKLIHHHQLPGQELSELQNTRPAGFLKQLKTIQLP
jgi:hypothetical protein